MILELPDQIFDKIINLTEITINTVCVNRKFLQHCMTKIKNRNWEDALGALISRDVSPDSEVYIHKLKIDGLVKIPRFGDQMLGLFCENGFKIGYYKIHYVENSEYNQSGDLSDLFRRHENPISLIQSHSSRFVPLLVNFIGRPYNELNIFSHEPLTVYVKFLLWDNDTRRYIAEHPYQYPFLRDWECDRKCSMLDIARTP